MYTPMASTPQMTPWATEPGKAFSSDVKFMEPPSNDKNENPLVFQRNTEVL